MRSAPTTAGGSKARWVTLSNRYGPLVLALFAFGGVLNRMGLLLEVIQRGPASFGLGRMLHSSLIQQITDPSVVASIGLLRNAFHTVVVPYGLWVGMSLIAHAYWFCTLIRLAVRRFQGQTPRIGRWSSPRLAFLTVLITALAKLWIDRTLVLAVAGDALALQALSQFTAIKVGQFQGPEALGAGGLVAAGVLVLGLYVVLCRWVGQWATRRGLI